LKVLISIILAFLLFGSNLLVKSNLLPIPLLGDVKNPSQAFSPINWTYYHNYTEIVDTLLATNKTYPNIVDVFPIGTSCLNNVIYCVRLTNESNLNRKPEILFVGCHHAREWIAAELPLFFVVYAVTHFGTDKNVTELVDKSEIFVVVALNVDGLDFFEKNDWESARSRYNARGVDLNRNYGYAWYGGGSSPFSEPETQAMRTLALAHSFTYALSFHSGIELILYPWGSTYDPPPDEAKFIEISKNLSRVTKGTPYRQSSRLYIANGTWDDWMYGVVGVFALTCEVFGFEPEGNVRWRGKTVYQYNPYPEYIQIVVLRWLPAFFYIISMAVNEAKTMS